MATTSGVADETQPANEEQPKDETEQSENAEDVAADNVLNLAGQLQQLGYNYGILKVDGKYSVFSHISGTKESLASVEEAMSNKGIDHFIKEVDVSTDDLKWNYFLQAVKQKPFEMTGDFIQTFTDDEMHIWGYYVTLSTASFDALASERQKMLLEIYQWLNG